jgi:valyl-tRNA synthetase
MSDQPISPVPSPQSSALETQGPVPFSDLPAQYDHAAAQAKWYPYWESQGYFHAEPNAKNADGSVKKPYCVVIPPPNVTGALHLGHALNNTLQDILCRMKRMQGYNVLWMPGTDHAGIATQAVVERRLFEEEKLTRHDLGREKLVERIWDWKAQYEKRILSQLKQLGASCDWERLRFTLDDQCARAVRETFFKLFADNKVYRGKRLVNWDTFLQTAVSDDEVFHEPTKGHFWHFNYPVIDPKPGEPTHVTIATTRPETMLGDTAVAVHPDPAKAFDKVSAELREKIIAATAKEKGELEEQATLLLERRAKMLPQLEKLRDMALRQVQLQLPLTGRTIPLICDEWAKPELGSGCVKITPAHDENDYQVWQRNLNIGAINIMNSDGTLNESVPEKYRGLTMKKAREAVVADMEAAELCVEIEDREIDLAHSDRSKTPIEPYLADQWFVKMGNCDYYIHDGSDEPLGEKQLVRDPGLAQSAMDAVTDGRVKIIPDRYSKTYLDWLSEKRDWPVGRQLWWGHRIPVWTCSFRNEAEREVVKNAASEIYKRDFDSEGEQQLSFYHEWDPDTIAGMAYLCVREDNKELIAEIEYAGFIQEQEVLDTWFSSALWPHSTLGWPDHTPELAHFYPTSTLITSRDIITLWVARMVLAGLYNMNEIPFHEVFIHPKILDGFGETMSKSKGNGVDPLDVIDKFGADSLRFGIAYLCTETQDVRLPVDFECPHCHALVTQTKKNRTLPRVECDKCKQPFGTQWSQSHGTEEDKKLPRGAAVSEKFELGRNFCNKLWNASRFALMNLGDGESASAGGGVGEPIKPNDLLLEDRWLLSRLATVTDEVTRALAEYRFADAARALYGFAWDEFCSFYVEMVKARFAVPEQRATAQQVLAHALDSLLRLLHPMTPFLTEEVWHLLNEAVPCRGLTSPARPSESICIAPWPEVEVKWIDKTIEAQFAKFQTVMGAVRNIRQEKNIPPREPIQFSVRCDDETVKLLQPMEPYFASMAGATATAWGQNVTPPERAASKPIEGMEVHVDISAFFDVDAERARLSKERDNLTQFVVTLSAKLANENFVSRAPANVVEEQRNKLSEIREQLESVEAALAKLA